MINSPNDLIAKRGIVQCVHYNTQNKKMVEKNYTFYLHDLHVLL